MKKVYGYARVSTQHQSIDRQIRNILAYDSSAIIRSEAYTGRKLEGRDELRKLLKIVKPGDTIIFDSVSRLSRNAADGLRVYEELYAAGIELVFLNEHHIDTATYRSAASQAVDMTGNAVVDAILEGVNKALAILRKQQIEQAFDQAQKEVDDLSERTKGGIETARISGKQIGQVAGAKLHVKKADASKAIIRQHSKDFNGTLTDAEVMKLAGIARNTYYKYKKELSEV